jgi:hypothetical protein
MNWIRGFKIMLYLFFIFIRYETSVGQGWSCVSCSFKYLALRYVFWRVLFDWFCHSTFLCWNVTVNQFHWSL